MNSHKCTALFLPYLSHTCTPTAPVPIVISWDSYSLLSMYGAQKACQIQTGSTTQTLIVHSNRSSLKSCHEASLPHCFSLQPQLLITKSDFRYPELISHVASLDTPWAVTAFTTQVPSPIALHLMPTESHRWPIMPLSKSTKLTTPHAKGYNKILVCV